MKRLPALLVVCTELCGRTLIALALCCACLPSRAKAAPGTEQYCAAIAAIADRGAQALDAANLARHRVRVDLTNDGHPREIEISREGSTAYPMIVDDAGVAINWDFFNNDFWEKVRWTDELSVLRVGKLIWVVAWNLDRLDGTAALAGAADGRAACVFDQTWLPPVMKVLAGGDPSRVAVYLATLLMRPQFLPSAGIDTKRVAENSRASLGPGQTLGAGSWQIDTGSGEPTTLVPVTFDWGGGRGCERTVLAAVLNDKVVPNSDDLEWPWKSGLPPMAPSLLQVLLNGPTCSGLVETPIRGSDGQTYVLFDNLRKSPGRVDRVRLLAAFRHGALEPLARLSWRVHNRGRVFASQ